MHILHGVSSGAGALIQKGGVVAGSSGLANLGQGTGPLVSGAIGLGRRLFGSRRRRKRRRQT